MHHEPASAICDKCDALATAEFLNSELEVHQFFCKEHEPACIPGKKSRSTFLQGRLPPNNWLSKAMSAPRESAEHESFRFEMCDMHLLGSHGECSYYMSILTDVDHFALWTNELADNVREFVLGETAGAAESFRFDSYTVGFMVPLIKAAYNERIAKKVVPLTKAEQAVIFLLRNPTCTDAEVASAVKTTIKQLNRFSSYKVLRTPLLRVTGS